MRLETEGTPHPVHGGLGHARLAGERAATPVRTAGGRGVQSSVDQLRYLLVGEGARAPRAQLIMQAFQTATEVAASPLTDRRLGQAQAGGDLFVGESLRGQQNNLNSSDQPIGQGARAGESLELLAILLR